MFRWTVTANTVLSQQRQNVTAEIDPTGSLSGKSPCKPANPAPCNNVNGAVGQTFNLSDPFPNGIIKPPGRDIATYQSLQYGNWVWAIAPKNPYAYYQQWNLDVQRELPDGTLVDLAYAAAKGTHLPDFSQQISALPDNYLSLGRVPVGSAGCPPDPNNPNKPPCDFLSAPVPNPFKELLGSKNNTSFNTAGTIPLQQLLLGPI